MIHTTNKVRIAVLGAGLIGRRHAEHVAGEATLAAIVDPAEAATTVARDLAVPLFASLEALLAVDKPDGLIIATPNQFHLPHGLQAIEAGIPVLIEKPIADSVDAAERLVQAADAADVPVLVGHHRRHNPLVDEAKKAIDAGRLGRVVAAHTTFWVHKPADYFDVAWRRQPGAGPVFINLIHDVDLLRYFCGDVASVQAVESNAVRGNAVEDTAVILLKFKTGVLGTVSVSDTIAAPWSWELSAGENPAYPPTSVASTMIGGTLGSLSIPDLGLWSYDGAPSWWQPLQRQSILPAAADPLVLQIRHFADVICGRAEPLMSGREGLETLRVITAIKQAAQTGQAVGIG